MIIKTKNCKEILVDDDFDTSILSNGTYVYINNLGYAILSTYITKLNGKSVIKYQKLHRYIMNAPKDIQVDHINGDRLDNRRLNLRLATNTQNSWNRCDKKGVSSQYRGVVYHKNRNKWQTQIRIGNGKRIYLGLFDNELDAYIAYCDARKKYHGEFANRVEVR